MTASNDEDGGGGGGGPIDLMTLDGRVARASAAVEKMRSRLATKEGREEARMNAGGDPFGALRDVAGQSTFRRLVERDVSAHEQEHKQALVRWVHELLQTRVGWDLIVAEADAMHAPNPTLSRASLLQAKNPSAIADTDANAEGGSSSSSGQVAKTYDEALRSLIDASHPTRAAVAMRRLDDLAAPVAAVRKELHGRRREVARRLGLADSWSLVIEAPPRARAREEEEKEDPRRDEASRAIEAGAAKEKPVASTSTLRQLAVAILDATEPLAIEQHKELKRRTGIEVTPALSIEDSFARDVREGWPAHLNTRWLEDVFRAIAPRPPRAVQLPPPIGGASFLRAASAWGMALRSSGVARSLPFALARDPYPIEPHAFGGALAIAVADPVFAKKKLGLPARSVDAYARALGRVLFVTLRRIAAGMLLPMMHDDGGDRIPDDAIEEIGARIFGRPLPKALGAAWAHGGLAGTSRGAFSSGWVDAPAQLIGALRAYDVVRSLVDRFDEDWFDNPRTGAHLAGMSAGPVWNSALASSSLDEGIEKKLARAFEERIG